MHYSIIKTVVDVIPFNGYASGWSTAEGELTFRKRFGGGIPRDRPYASLEVRTEATMDGGAKMIGDMFIVEVRSLEGLAKADSRAVGIMKSVPTMRFHAIQDDEDFMLM